MYKKLLCCLVTLLWARSMKAQVGYGIQCPGGGGGGLPYEIDGDARCLA